MPSLSFSDKLQRSGVNQEHVALELSKLIDFKCFLLIPPVSQGICRGAARRQQTL